MLRCERTDWSHRDCSVCTVRKSVAEKRPATVGTILPKIVRGVRRAISARVWFCLWR